MADRSEAGYAVTELANHIDERMAVDVFQTMTNDVAAVNEANGWYDDQRTFGDDCALLHSEVSEALEAYRKHDDQHIGSELADILIRLLDTCHRRDIDLYGEYVAKMAINRGRPYRHGNKRL